VHTNRKNRLEQQRLNVVIFVKYNLLLDMRQKVKKEKWDTMIVYVYVILDQMISRLLKRKILV